MVVPKKLSSTKRFGSRYGRRIRHKLAEVEYEQRKPKRCPYCSDLKVKRLAVGIWFCKKCKTKFTGKAYTLAKKIRIKEELPEEEVVEESTEEKKEEPEEKEESKKKKSNKKGGTQQQVAGTTQGGIGTVGSDSEKNG